MRWIVTQIGARQHYALPVSFCLLGHLKLFYTEAWCRWGREILRRGPGPLRAYANRYHAGLPPSKVRAFTNSYAAFHLRHFPGHSASVPDLHRFYVRTGAWFSRRVAEDLSRCDFDPHHDYLFAFNTGALETLHMFRKRGVFTVLDQIDAGREHERLVRLEREKWPGWEDATAPVPEEYWDRIQQEWAAADLVMVNSEWTRSSLLLHGVPAEKVIIVPLAYSPPPGLRPRETSAGPLTVLWIGNVFLSKGIQYLIEAARRLPAVRFLVAGSIGIREEKVRSAPANVTFLGRVQRNETARLYRQADVFILPTISDGFAITQLEAMAHGLPVITTPNCGRVVTHGRNGLIVPVGNVEALADAIAQLDADRKGLAGLSNAAFWTAQEYDLPKNAQKIEEAVLRVKSMRAATPHRTGAMGNE